jgi:hypothetical protein
MVLNGLLLLSLAIKLIGLLHLAQPLTQGVLCCHVRRTFFRLWHLGRRLHIHSGLRQLRGIRRCCGDGWLVLARTYLDAICVALAQTCH